MRFKEIRWLMLTVLIGCLAYNSWRSHGLMHVSFAPIRIRLTTALHNSADGSLPTGEQQTTTPGDAHVKSVKIRVKQGASSSEHPKLKLTVRRAESNSGGSSSRVQNSQSDVHSQQRAQQDLSDLKEVPRSEGAEQNRNAKQEAPFNQGLDGDRQVSSSSEAGSNVVVLHSGGAASDDKMPFGAVSADTAGQWTITQAVASADKPSWAAVLGNRTGQWAVEERGQGVKTGQPAAAAAAAEPPEGQSCEAWLKEADVRTGGRDFEASPITVYDRSNEDNAGCDVPCHFRMAGMAPNYDAGFGLDRSVHGGAMVLINMESTSNYPMIDVARAKLDGWDIVMTTRLDSDVPAGYLSWAEYMFMRPLSEKQADVAAFISNCGAKSIRLQALEVLNKTVNIDSFGRCMHNADTAERKLDALLRYKFSLAFENSQELDYVTEKYAQALEAGTVPIVIGATNVEDYEVAPNSMLVIKTMEDVPSVAARLQHLLANQTAYEEMLAWKRDGPQDKFLALVDLNVVHSNCRLCIHLATAVRAAEEAAAQPPLPCRCRRAASGEVVHHLRVRERGRFHFRDVFLTSGDLSVAALHRAILREFGQAGHRPIWVSQRPDFRGGALRLEDESSAGVDRMVDLRIYRVYAVGETQRAALYGDAALDTDAKVQTAVEQRPCLQLEVVFV